MSDVKVRLRNVIKEFPARGRETPVRAVDNIALDIYDGEFFALLGPSGCGKTTTLRLIAGFEQPTAGDILIDGQQMAGIPPYFRPVNTVFQDYALFPHMTVLQNVMFGLEMAGMARKEAGKRAAEALEMVRLPQVGHRKPRELSGGQQQRVALARALVRRPAVLLLDEPLGALDLKLRRDMQIELKAMQLELGLTFIFVTHDQEEAMTMANRIAVMEGGHVLQVGRPEDIYETPASRFVADFIGETNFLEGTLIDLAAEAGTVRLDEDTCVQALPGTTPPAVPAQITVAIRPERILLREYDGAAPVDGMTCIAGQIRQVNYIGTDTRYVVRIAGEMDITVRVQNTEYQKALAFKDRQMVQVLWHPANARLLLE
ncbi:MAG: ABC transporter ATP-binding protein [Anaerolineae bacterium]|nr:ABC transporter ATP-binding protein [Anaerolineae bacterium]